MMTKSGNSFTLVRFTACVLLCCIAVMGRAAEQASVDRIQSVETLVEKSSAANRILASGNQPAIKLRIEAQNHLAGARSAIDTGNQAEANRLLNLATGTMFEAVRVLEQDQNLVDKHQRDFDARLDSITALCEAYDRISREKALGPGSESELYPIVNSKLDKARTLRSEGKINEGRRLLDEAYVAAKVGIEHLRGGDTLVRSLNFESREEEYHYEIDRNDTHRMLVLVLLKEKMGADSSLDARVRNYMESADGLRTRAEAEAGKGDYERAIQTLEDSTREIVKAIRSAGVYIPG
ncbi:MAG: hypothetical protein WBO37_10160 [Gammaproteobacteria bacterium]